MAGSDDAICVPIRGQDEHVELRPSELPDDESSVAEMLMGEMAPLEVWRQVAIAYYHLGKTDQMMRLLELATSPEAEQQYPDAAPERISLLNMLAAFKLREAMLAKSGEERKRLHAAASRALNRADQTEIHRTELHTTTWVTQGLQAMSNLEMSNALSFLQNAFTVDPGNVPALLVQAAVYYRSGQYPKASALYARVIREHPGVPAAVRVGFGMCQYRIGNVEATRLAMERALELEPANVDALVNLAVLHLSLAADEFRAQSSRRGGALTVKERREQQRRARAAAASHSRRATKMLQRAYAADPTHPVALLHLANQFFWQWQRISGVTATVSLHGATVQTSRDIRDLVAKSRLVRVGDVVYNLRETGHTATSLRLVEGAHKLPAADAANGVVLSSDGRTVSGAKVECKDFDKTLALARQALQHTQNTCLAAEAEYFLGRVHHSNGEYAKAEHHYQKSIRAFAQDPQNKQKGAIFPLPTFGMAQLHLRSGRLAQAQTLLEQLRQHDSSSAVVAHLLAYVYSKHTKHHSRAKDLLRRVLEQKGSDPEVLVEQAQLLYRAGGSKNELMALRKLLLAAESHRERGRRVPVELLNNIAALKHRAGDLDGALSVYTEALKEAAAVKGQRNAPVEESKISPSAPPAQRFCMKHGLPRSILCGATSATITFNIAALYDDKGDAATASSYLNELLRGYPTHADALARMGRIQERRYHATRAAQLYEKAAAAAKETWRESGGEAMTDRVATPTLMLGALRQKQGQASIAQKQFESVISRTATAHDTYALLGMGSVYLSAVRVPGKEHKNLLYAKKFFESVLKADPKNLYAANGLGVLLAEQGHFDAAVSVFTAVHESATWFQDAWINLAHVLALRGQHARAINLYRSAAAKFTDGTDVNLLRCTAAAMYSAADFSGAERTLRKALQLEPDDLSLWHNLATAQLGFFEYMLEWGERMEYDMAARAGEADAPPESRYTFHGIRKQRDLDKAEGKFQLARRTFQWLASLTEESEGGKLPYDRDAVANTLSRYENVGELLEEHKRVQEEVDAHLRQERQQHLSTKERAEQLLRQKADEQRRREQEAKEALELQRKQFEEEMASKTKEVDLALSAAERGGRGGGRERSGGNIAEGAPSRTGASAAAGDDVDALLNGPGMVPGAGTLDSDDDDDGLLDAQADDLFGDAGSSKKDEGGEDDDDQLFGGISRDQEDDQVLGLFGEDEEDEEEGGAENGGAGDGAGAGAGAGGSERKRTRVVDDEEDEDEEGEAAAANGGEGGAPAGEETEAPAKRQRQE